MSAYLSVRPAHSVYLLKVLSMTSGNILAFLCVIGTTPKDVQFYHVCQT